MAMAQEKRSLITTLRQRKKAWIWHILCHDSLLRTVTKEKINRTKARRRTQNMLLDHLIDTKSERFTRMKRKAADGEEWEEEPAL